MTQKELAAALGLSPAVVSRCVAAGMPADDAEAARAWRAARVRPRVAADKAASRARGAHWLDVGQERARLLRTQRREAEHRLAKLRGEFAPIGYIREVMGAIGAEMGQRLEAAPAMLRRKHPELGADALDSLAATLVRLRNDTDAAMRDAARRAAAEAHYTYPTTDDEGDDAESTD
jgi:phage terminase Nu1 subunit (DNA packaging protein)